MNKLALKICFSGLALAFPLAAQTTVTLDGGGAVAWGAGVEAVSQKFQGLRDESSYDAVRQFKQNNAQGPNRIFYFHQNRLYKVSSVYGNMNENGSKALLNRLISAYGRPDKIIDTRNNMALSILSSLVEGYVGVGGHYAQYVWNSNRNLTVSMTEPIANVAGLIKLRWVTVEYFDPVAERGAEAAISVERQARLEEQARQREEAAKQQLEEYAREYEEGMRPYYERQRQEAQAAQEWEARKARQEMEERARLAEEAKRAEEARQAALEAALERTKIRVGLKGTAGLNNLGTRGVVGLDSANGFGLGLGGVIDMRLFASKGRYSELRLNTGFDLAWRKYSWSGYGHESLHEVKNEVSEMAVSIPVYFRGALRAPTFGEVLFLDAGPQLDIPILTSAKPDEDGAGKQSVNWGIGVGAGIYFGRQLAVDARLVFSDIVQYNLGVTWMWGYLVSKNSSLGSGASSGGDSKKDTNGSSPSHNRNYGESSRSAPDYGPAECRGSGAQCPREYGVENFMGTVSGSRSNANIQNTIKQNMNTLRKAYNQRLCEKPDLCGTIIVSFNIDEYGKVLYAQKERSTINDPVLEGIITAEIKSWNFGRAGERGDVTSVRYPFRFSQ